MSSAPVRPIQIPIAIGAMKPGVDRGAAALDDSLRSRLVERNRDTILARLRESQHVSVEPFETPDTRRYPGQALHLDAIARASEELGRLVADAIARGDLALTMGGDHSAGIGSVSGAASQCERLAVIWVDAHADMNWPEVSLTGRMHGMSLGACLGRGPSEVAELFGPRPKLAERDTYLIGVRLLDPGEEQWLATGEIHLRTMPDVDCIGLDVTIQQVIREIQESGADAVHLSFDVDSLDPLVLSGTGTSERGGFTYREASRIIRLMRDSGLPVRSMDWVELNPDLDPTGDSTDVAADLLAIALGEEIIQRGATGCGGR